MKSFKSLFYVSFLAFLITSFFSCGNIPNNTPTSTVTEPGTAWTVVSDSLNNGSLSTIKQDVVYVIAEPSWGQSFHYAFNSGYLIWLIIGSILTGGMIIFYTLYQFDAIPFKKEPNHIVVNIGSFLTLVLGIWIIVHQPEDIKSNNQKKWVKTYYDNVIKTEGSTQRLWDSLEVSNRIVGASYKK